MRTYEEIMADAADGSPFSNHTEWEIWSYNWCEECTNDSPELVDKGQGCPLIMAALMKKTPREWTLREGTFCDFSCSEFRRRPGPGDEPPEEPPAPPDCGGQVDMFEVFADQIVEQVESAVTV